MLSATLDIELKFFIELLQSQHRRTWVLDRGDRYTIYNRTHLQEAKTVNHYLAL